MPKKSSSAAQAGQDDFGGSIVQPGDVTGCYYILFSGLQKDTKWKDVKDFLRHGEVQMDNVEVFPNSTSGWVRLYGRANFDKAMTRFQTAPCRGRFLIVDGRNAATPTFIRKLHPPGTGDAQSSAAHGHAFAAQIPPLSREEPSQYMPQNVSVSYTNPYTNPYATTSAAPGYYDAGSYEAGSSEPTSLEYYKAHPTQQHDAPPAQRTGNEGTEQYAASSAAFVDGMAGLSVSGPSGGSSQVAGADFKFVVTRRDGRELDAALVTDFIQAYAPLCKGAVLRVDVLKQRRRGGAPSRALVVFADAGVCRIAREGLFDKSLDGVELEQGPDLPPPAAGAEEAGEEEEEEGGEPVQKKAPPQPPRPKPEGADPRTRREKRRDQRRESNQRGKMFRAQREAEAAEGDGGGPSSSSSPADAAAAPGAPGPSSSSAADPHHGDAGGKGKGKEKEAKVLVVDGSSGRHHKHRSDEKKRHK